MFFRGGAVCGFGFCFCLLVFCFVFVTVGFKGGIGSNIKGSGIHWAFAWSLKYGISLNLHYLKCKDHYSHFTGEQTEVQRLFA